MVSLNMQSSGGLAERTGAEAHGRARGTGLYACHALGPARKPQRIIRRHAAGLAVSGARRQPAYRVTGNGDAPPRMARTVATTKATTPPASAPVSTGSPAPFLA